MMVCYMMAILFFMQLKKAANQNDLRLFERYGGISLDLDENLLSIEEIKDQPAGKEVERLRDELVPIAVK